MERKPTEITDSFESSIKADYEKHLLFSKKNGMILEETLTPETPLYHFLPFYALLNIIENKKTSFANINEWEDPGEGFGRNIVWQTGAPIDVVDNYFSYFGQCWTDVKETDAMWRIYSPDKQGVCIKSSVEKLKKSLGASFKNILYLKRIRYGENENYASSRKLNFDDTGKYNTGILGSSIFKREEFSHEKEVRVLVIKPKDEEETKRIDVQMNYKILIDEVVFHPNAEKYYIDAFSGYFKRKKIKYSQSKLYKKSIYQITAKSHK